MYVNHHLTYRDAVSYLFDRVDDLHLTDAIPTKLYKKKISTKPLISALNKADRHISAIRKKREIAALFIPKNITLFPLCSHAVFQGEVVDAIASDSQAEQHPNAIDFYINENPWVELQSIHSEIINVYTDHPGHGKPVNVNLQRADYETFSSAVRNKGPKYLYYDAEKRVLRLSSPFETDVFLVFEATMVAASINIRKLPAGTIDDVSASKATNEEHELWKMMKIKTPELYVELLLDVAVRFLLPGVAEPVSPQEIQSRLQGFETDNGPTAFQVSGQYPAFGILE
jgi:hypothetical protein